MNEEENDQTTDDYSAYNGPTRIKIDDPES